MNGTTIKASNYKQSKLNVVSIWLSLWVYTLVCISPMNTWAAPVRTYEQQLEQVRLYINNQMFEAARTELVKLSETTDGKQDERVYIALAKVSYKLHHITRALSYLRTARRLAQKTQAKQKLSALYEEWLNTYGLVRLEPADQVREGLVELSRKRKLINKDRQAALEYVQRTLKSGVSLPISLYLPYGSYVVNGTSFKLKRNEPTPIVEVLVVPTEKSNPQSDSKAFNQQWLYIGLGTAAMVALGIFAYSISQEEPSPNPTLTITISDGR